MTHQRICEHEEKVILNFVYNAVLDMKISQQKNQDNALKFLPEYYSNKIINHLNKPCTRCLKDFDEKI